MFVLKKEGNLGVKIDVIIKKFKNEGNKGNRKIIKF